MAEMVSENRGWYDFELIIVDMVKHKDGWFAVIHSPFGVSYRYGMTDEEKEELLKKCEEASEIMRKKLSG